MRLLVACLVCFATFGTLSAPAAQGRHFYVDPAGHDDASGHSPAHAWRTVARVNHATLRPGDTVSFRANRAFSDEPLTPSFPGANGAPIVFDSYGSGRALLRRGVVVASISWLTFRGLEVRGTAEGFGSGGGSGARHINIIDNKISHVERGINSPNRADQDWLIAGNEIDHTGDSGVIAQGSSFTIVRNRIRDTGLDAHITYGKHGIYSKSAHVRIFANVIVDFSAEGISTRFPDARILNNVIRGGQSGIGYYRDDPSPGGTTTICGNTISSVNDGVYIGPDGGAGATNERFRVMNNVILSETGRGVDAPADRNKVKMRDNFFKQAPAKAIPSRLAMPCSAAS
jgi:hypothetical protein